MPANNIRTQIVFSELFPVYDRPNDLRSRVIIGYQRNNDPTQVDTLDTYCSLEDGGRRTVQWAGTEVNEYVATMTIPWEEKTAEYPQDQLFANFPQEDFSSQEMRFIMDNWNFRTQVNVPYWAYRQFEVINRLIPLAGDRRRYITLEIRRRIFALSGL